MSSERDGISELSLVSDQGGLGIGGRSGSVEDEAHVADPHTEASNVHVALRDHFGGVVELALGNETGHRRAAHQYDIAQLGRPGEAQLPRSSLGLKIRNTPIETSPDSHLL